MKTITTTNKLSLVVSFLGIGVAPKRFGAYGWVEKFSHGVIFPK